MYYNYLVSENYLVRYYYIIYYYCNFIILNQC